MALHKFLKPEAKKKLKAAVEAVENRSAAEVVVAVRPWSGMYRHVDYLGGTVLAYAGLIYMMYADRVFSLLAILINTAILFAVGALLVALILPVRRLLTGSKRLDHNTETAARAAFYNLGVASTRDRSGILVYVSLAEMRCRVVEDVGVKAKVDEGEWKKAASAVEASVRVGGLGPEGVDRLARAIEAMGPQLEKALPRRADDINELPDLADDDEDEAKS